MLLSLLASMLLVATPAADQRIAERAVAEGVRRPPRLDHPATTTDPPTRACRALDRRRGQGLRDVARSPTFEPRGSFAARGVVYVYRDAATAKRHLPGDER